LGLIREDQGVLRSANPIYNEVTGKRYPIELKWVRDAKTREQGLVQLGRYMDTLGAKEGWLILFDLQSQLPWERRLYWDTIGCDSGSMHIAGA
jgi:hypothetical protein